MVFSLALVIAGALAQSKVKTTFKMPKNASYARGRVLVKANSAYKDEIAQLSSGGSSATVKNVPLRSIIPAVKPQLDRFGAAGVGARAQKQTIDISRYYAITFDQSLDVEGYINQLYATGYFEIVEPDYKYKTDFTPNDPGVALQYYLNLIKAYDAWDITQGDTSVVIAIVDTGGNLTHEDIAPKLYRNWKEYPPNGIDDDSNGFIDDYQGWDFIGADTLNLYKANYDPAIDGDNNPSIVEGGEISHGTMVAGCAGAATNNGKGMAGVGYKTQLMFTKQSADNQLTTDGSEYNVYAGMLYAANLLHGQGRRGIINCSFGGSGQSQIIQDYINHIVLDLNCLIVAAAGNSHSTSPSYPAAYDNVLSAAATDQNDKKASFTNYGTTVDISAPGVGIYTAQFDDDYTTVDGTSFSSPITSGAAALVWAKNPTFTAVQVGEQLRVSADGTALYTANPSFVNKLGKGRLDIKRALTLELPSIRASNPKLINQNGFAPVPGDKAFLSFNFTNYLQSTSAGIQISITSSSTAVTISTGTIAPGIIAGGSTISNQLTPFQLAIASTAPQNTEVDLLITYSDGGYTDYQYVSFFVNPSFIDVNSNQINTTVTGIGRIGFQDTQDATRTQGSGFIFNQNPLLYEMGLIMGTSPTNLYNNVRGINGNFDEDFSSTIQIKQIVPGVRSYSEIFGEFSNSTTAAQQAVVVDYRSLVWKDSPYDKFVIMEYQVKNTTANTLNNFYFGIFSDWDITTDGANDAAAWDNSNKLGYVYAAQTSAKPYAGIQLLTGAPAYYAIDNDSTSTSIPFGLYSKFTDTEKYTTISAAIGSGRERLQAGVLSPTGNDVSHVVSAGPLTIAAGQTITLAFALHAAANLSDLQTSAKYADSVYNYTLKAVKPIGDSVAVCYNSPATLNTSGASTLKWYTTFTGGQSFFTGTQYVTGNLKNDTTFYVSNADNSYESVRAKLIATTKANPKISLSGSPKLCQGDSITLSVAPADSTIWSNGQKTNTIEVKTAGSYSVKVKDKTLNCTSQSNTIDVVVNVNPTAAFSISGNLDVTQPITFTDQSTNAAAWFWDFGDGQTDTSENPTHTYTAMKNYTVKLSVTTSAGCSASKSNSVSITTGIQDPETDGITLYPNPVSTQGFQVVVDQNNLNQASISLLNSLGQVIFIQDISTSAQHVEITIPSSGLTDGLYIVKMNVGNKVVARKVIKVQ